jgi:hypothetical protein
LTACSRVLSEKLMVAQLVKKLPSFCGARVHKVMWREVPLSYSFFIKFRFVPVLSFTLAFPKINLCVFRICEDWYSIRWFNFLGLMAVIVYGEQILWSRSVLLNLQVVCPCDGLDNTTVDTYYCRHIYTMFSCQYVRKS